MSLEEDVLRNAQTKMFVSFANTVVVHGESQVYKKSGAGGQSDLGLLDNIAF